MGRGFVQPVDDFGAHNPASHPELLDKMAEEFQASGYNIKALVRWITASEAYSLSSVMTKQNEKDAKFKPDETIQVFTTFANPNLKVNYVPAQSVKPTGPVNPNPPTDPEVDLERKNIIDAVVVRIMKARKTEKFN